MTQFRYLSSDTFQFRKQALSFLRFLAEQGCTTILTSEMNLSQPDDDLQFMSDGVLDIEMGKGASVRSIAITKFRGSDFHAGTHTLKLCATGVDVFPRLLPIEQIADFVYETISSGIPDLDELLQGGIERGTVTIITGPSGVGKMQSFQLSHAPSSC